MSRCIFLPSAAGLPEAVGPVRASRPQAFRRPAGLWPSQRQALRRLRPKPEGRRRVAARLRISETRTVDPLLALQAIAPMTRWVATCILRHPTSTFLVASPLPERVGRLPTNPLRTRPAASDGVA